MKAGIVSFYTLLVTLSLVIASSLAMGQTTFDNRDKLLDAFSKSNITYIDGYLGNYVNLHVGNESGVYTRQQANSILTKFFKDNPPQTVSFVKDGESKLNYFCIALYTSKGKNWRVYILFYETNNKYTIKQIDIEKE